MSIVLQSRARSEHVTPHGYSDDYQAVQDAKELALEHYMKYDASLRDLCEEISELGSLEDDWNGEGAAAVSAVATARAILILSNSAKEVSLRGYKWIAPNIAPTADGGVSMSWRLPDRRLLIIVHPERSDVVCVHKEASGDPIRHVVDLHTVPEYVIWVLNRF